MAERARSGRTAVRGDVQSLDKIAMIVYEAVATMDYEGHVAELADLCRTTGLPETQVRTALDQLIAEGHVCAGTAGYFLDAPDWAP